MGRKAWDELIALPPLHSGPYEERNAQQMRMMDCAPRGWMHFDDESVTASLYEMYTSLQQVSIQTARCVHP